MKKILSWNKNIKIAISDLEDGNMRSFGDTAEKSIIENQILLSKHIDLDKQAVARINTQYDRDTFVEFAEISTNNIAKYSILLPEKRILPSDGLIARSPNIGLLLPLADCLGMVFYDEEKSILGLLHAGRHNLEQFGPIKFVQFLQKNYGSSPEKIKIYFSPYAKQYKIYKFNNQTMTEVAMSQLTEAGILANNITDELSDVVNDNNYPSNSSGDKTRRFAIVVTIA